MKYLLFLFFPLIFSLAEGVGNETNQLFEEEQKAKKIKSRIKDIAKFEITRENLLIGYGLVVGLQGTGDTLKSTPFTTETLTNMLERLGVNVRDKANNLNTRNVATVIVTSKLPAFSMQGSKIDVHVSALGDSRSLKGGVLLVTPLKAADGEVYAVAQGPIGTFGITAQGQSGSNVQQGNSTNGIIANGAIVEKELDTSLNDNKTLRLSLNRQDFTTAQNLVNAANKEFPNSANMEDSGHISIKVPEAFHKNPGMFIAKLENIKVKTDNRALIVLDTNNGVITITENVKIKPCVVSHGEITINIEEKPNIKTDILGIPHLVPSSKISISQGSKNMSHMEATPTLADLKDMLRALNLSPKAIMQVIQNIHAAGALDADLVIR